MEDILSGREPDTKNPDDVIGLAPLLKPSVLKRLSVSLSREGIDISSVLALSEYLEDTDTKRLMETVDFTSIADMDEGLLERLLPLLGPYASEVIFQKIIDGELDAHYLEMLGSQPISQIEAAVVFGALDTDALDIMRRTNYNSYRMNRAGIIKLFICPECGEVLQHMYPRRCRCGFRPEYTDGIILLLKNASAIALAEAPAEFPEVKTDTALGLMLGAADFDSIERYCIASQYHELVVVDSSLERLRRLAAEMRPKCYEQLVLVCDSLRSPHLLRKHFDFTVDNRKDS